MPTSGRSGVHPHQRSITAAQQRGSRGMPALRSVESSRVVWVVWRVQPVPQFLSCLAVLFHANLLCGALCMSLRFLKKGNPFTEAQQAADPKLHQHPHVECDVDYLAGFLSGCSQLHWPHCIMLSRLVYGPGNQLCPNLSAMAHIPRNPHLTGFTGKQPHPLPAPHSCCPGSTELWQPPPHHTQPTHKNYTKSQPTSTPSRTASCCPG